MYSTCPSEGKNHKFTISSLKDKLWFMLMWIPSTAEVTLWWLSPSRSAQVKLSSPFECRKIENATPHESSSRSQQLSSALIIHKHIPYHRLHPFPPKKSTHIKEKRTRTHLAPLSLKVCRALFEFTYHHDNYSLFTDCARGRFSPSLF